MSTYNTVVFVTTKSIADTLDLPMLATADRTSSNLTQTEWTWVWIEANKLQPLRIWMYNSDALEEHFMFLRTGESDEDAEVIGTLPCGYRIGIIAPESEPDNSAAREMAHYIVDFEYQSFYEHILIEYPDYTGEGDEDMHEVIKRALADEDICHVFKTAYIYLRDH